MPVIMTPKSPVFVPEYGVPPPGAIPQPGGGWVMPGATPGVTPPAPPAAPPAAPPVSAPLPTPAIPPPKPPPPPLESLVAAASTAGGKTGVLPGGAPAWTSFIPEAKVDRRGNVTNLGFRKDIILEKLRKANAPEETISDFILKNHDVREASLGDNIIVDGLDSRGSLKAIVVDKREYAKTEDIASPDKKLDAYIKLGILPEGTKLIGDGSAAAVKGFNKTYKTDVSADFPYALPNLVSNVEMSHKEQLAFEKSLKSTPRYLQQAYEKGGIEGYNKAAIVYNTFIENWNVSTTASFEKKMDDQLVGMPPELQDAYKKGGIEGYNNAVNVYAQKVASYNLASQYYYESANKEFTDTLRKEWPSLYKVYVEKGADAYDALANELQKEHPNAAVLSRYLSAEELKVYNEPGMSAGNKYAILEQSGLLPKDSTKYSGESSGQPVISYGQDYSQALLHAKPQQYLLMGAEMVVPGLYVGLNWNKLSTGEKILWVSIDALTLLPFARGAATAARGVATAGKLERAGAIFRALGHEAVAQVRAPVDIVLHPVGTAKALARDVRGVAELIANKSRLSVWTITTADGVIQLRIGKDIKTEAEAMALRDRITELAAQSGGHIIIKAGSKEIELARSPLMREAGGGMAHTSPDIEKLLESKVVKASAGMPEKETGLFLSVEPSTEFISGSAFGKGVVPVAKEATEAVLDVAKYRVSELVRIDKAPVRVLDFANAKNVPDELARAIQKYVRENEGIVYGSLNEYTKLKKAKLPNDLDLVFHNQQKAIEDILNIAKQEGYQVRRSPHAVEVYRDGKWTQIADIADVTEHRAMLPAGLSQKTLTKVDGILTETIGEQYLRQSMGAVSKTEKAAERAKRVNTAAKEVKKMLKEAGAETRKPGVFIASPESASKSVSTKKLFHSDPAQGKVYPAAELERKFRVGEDIPKPAQHLWARVGPRAERIEIYLEKPLTWRQIAKLKAETVLEFAKAPFKEPIKITERQGALLAEEAFDASIIERDMTKLEDAVRGAGNEREADVLRRIAREIAATRRAPGMALRAGRVTSEILASRTGRESLERLTPAQRKIVMRSISERKVLRPLSESFRPVKARGIMAQERAIERPPRSISQLPPRIDIPRPPRGTERPGIERVQPPRVATERPPRETAPIPPRTTAPRIETTRPPREIAPTPPRAGAPRPPEPPRPPRPSAPRPPEPPRTGVPRPPRPGTPRPPEPPRPPRPPREEKGRLPKSGSEKKLKEWTPEEIKAAVAFRMGSLGRKGAQKPVTVAIRPPYGETDKKVFVGSTPEGMHVAANMLSAKKSIQLLRKGTVPDVIENRQGFARYTIHRLTKPGVAEPGKITFTSGTARTPVQLRSTLKGKVYHTETSGGVLLSRRPLGKHRKY